MAEAERCLRALAVPFFHHELVKQLLLAAMVSPQHEDALLGLLDKLASSNIVSQTQTAQVCAVPPPLSAAASGESATPSCRIYCTHLRCPLGRQQRRLALISKRSARQQLQPVTS